MGHSHGHNFGVDVYAQRSRLSSHNAMLKLIFCVVLLIYVVAVNSKLVALFVTFSMPMILVTIGGTPIMAYLRLFRLPLLFVGISAIVLLFSISGEPRNFIDIPLFGGYISITRISLEHTLTVSSKAIGAVTCLISLSLSTPVHELIDVMKMFRIPAIVIELMYLIYRYVFVLMDVQRHMTTASEARLGYRDVKASFRTFSRIASNVFSVSFVRSSKTFDSMEARCYDGDLRFYVRKKPVKIVFVVFIFFYFVAVVGLTFLN